MRFETATVFVDPDENRASEINSDGLPSLGVVRKQPTLGHGIDYNEAIKQGKEHEWEESAEIILDKPVQAIENKPVERKTEPFPFSSS